MTDTIVKPAKSISGEICAPPSKAYTQRMLIAASLAKGKSKLSNPLISDDTEAALRAVKSLGAKVTSESGCWIIEGSPSLTGSKKSIDVSDSGATLRFMIPVAALAPDSSVFVLGRSLAKRPVQPLLDCMKQLGAETSISKVGRKTAINVDGGGIKGGRAQIPGDISSQFISGLMFACPLAESNTTLTLTTPLESKSYVLMTQNVLSRYGVEVDIPEDFVRLKIPAGQAYRAVDQLVPGDFSSAAFLLAAAAVTDSAVQVKHLDYGTVQGDKIILRILKDMGVNGKVCKDQIEIDGRSGTLSPVDVDVRDVPDLVPVIAALACFANGTSNIREARRLRLKESDRLNSLHVELSKMGADIEVTEDSLTIKGPCPLHGAIIDPHRDHRIAMACAVAALGAEGETTITDSECVRKSYPRFFEDLKMLGVDIVGQ